MDTIDVINAYYRTIDDGDYEELASLIHPDLVHDRPDQTINGRDYFIEFMQTNRPLTDTLHNIAGWYRGSSGVAVTGQLQQNNQLIFEFVDTFALAADQITTITTYIRPPD